jgi:hypothetical protein
MKRHIKNGGKKAEDQATEPNQGPAVNSIYVALPEDGNMECRNMWQEVRNKCKLVKKCIQLVFLHQWIIF